MNLLVTGFGPFADAEDNASGHLARNSGHPFEVLEVSYRAVDDFFRGLSSDPPGAVLLLGVDVRAKRMRLETVAHNVIGPKPDVRGEIWGPGPLDPMAPPQFAATLWTPEILVETAQKEPGCDAGGYLCNFSFFRALQACPRSRVGFIHVPPFEAIPEKAQLAELGGIAEACLPMAAV